MGFAAQLNRYTNTRIQSNLLKGQKNSMSQLLSHIPLIAGSLVVGGVVIASGGSMLQSGIAGVATGATGLATSALVTQSQISRQRLVEQERDRLRLEVEKQKQLSTFRNELENLQGLRESLQQSINALKQYKDDSNKDTYISSQSEGGITTYKLVAEQDREKSTEEKIEDETKFIADFLASRDIKIKTTPTEEPADDIINSLSKFLGENYDSLRDLLARIKRSMQQGSQFSLYLKEYTQKDINNVCQFCTRLHAIAFLEEYRYFKAPQYLIKAKATTLPAAHSFFLANG